MAAATYEQGTVSVAISSSATSPRHSSPEEFEVEDESKISQSAHWQASSGSTSRPLLTPTPLQKRRRVTRACDECRRKKIKCDGKQPCTHCTVYSYDCTYDQPSNRRKNPAPQYIEALETRLQRAEALLRTLLPNVDLNDPNIDTAIQQRRQVGGSLREPPRPGSGGKSGNASESEQDGQLRSMIESTGQLDLDENGMWDFHGGSSGTVFIERMREQFGGLLGGDYGTPFLPKLPPATATFDSPKSSPESPYESGLPNTMDLPSREAARALCDDALNCGCSLLRFVHAPSFNIMFNRIYDASVEEFGDEEHRFLPLLYVVLALGCLFYTDPIDARKESTSNSYKADIDQGLKYFRAARQMIDITDCRDITSLQAVLFMILFLQSTANLSTCYSYIGIALRSALRMGLHRNLVGNFNPIEIETRRRAFWIIRKMDTYVSAYLGFPHILSSDDIDQELPIEVDDEYITKDGVLPMPHGNSSIFSASNAHTRLMAILAKVIKYIYPVKVSEQSVQGSAKSSYVISHAKIKEIERDLADWLDKLPMALRPGGEGAADVVRVQQLLRLAYAHVQMMLYRPFLHYVSQNASTVKKFDDRSYACAAACVNVSRNIVHITSELKRRGLLIGAYWFTMYTTFFAILSLVYFVLENPDEQGSQEILADANAGKDALKGLAQRSQAADRCSVALEELFEQLPERLTNKPTTSISSKKKRGAPSSNPPVSQTVQSAPNLPHHQKEIPEGIPRSTTFHVPVSMPIGHILRPSLDGNRFQSNRFSNFDITSPTDMSAAGTPDSSSTGSMQQPLYTPIQQQYVNNTLPDLSAMMFPSADPFAYPNQPLMEFDNLKRGNVDMVPGSQAPSIYLPNGTGSGHGIYDDLEGQLFGPFAPYLSQGQQNYDMQMQMNGGNNLISGMNLEEMVFNTSMTPNNDMNFDGIFTGEGEEWGNILADGR